MITIHTSECIGCGKCADVCPTQAIYKAGDKVFVREELCRSCGACVEACPTGAITMTHPSFAPSSTDRVPQHPFGLPFRTRRAGMRGGRHRYGRRRV